MEDAIRGLGPGEENARWSLQLSMGVFELLEGLLVFLVLSWGIPKIRELSAAHFEKQPFAEPYINSFLAENMRMIATVLLFGLVLIIPGFLAYCFLIFVPYIALFSKPYREDKVSALRYSYRLTKKVFWPIFGIFILTTMLNVAIEFLPNMYAELFNWPVRIAFMAAGLLIGIFTYSFMFVMFERAVTEDKDGFDV